MGLMAASFHQQALDYWTELGADRGMPSIQDLKPGRLDEFRNQSFLIALAGKDHTRIVSFVGRDVYRGSHGGPINAGELVAGIAGDSLLGLLSDDFDRVIQTGSAVKFDYAHVVGAGFYGAGVLMPFGAAGQVQFIWGVLGESADGADMDDAMSGFDIAMDADDFGADDLAADDEGGMFDADPETPTKAPTPPVPPAPAAASSMADTEHLGFDTYQDRWEGEAYEIAAIVTDEDSAVDFGPDSGQTATGFDDYADACVGAAQHLEDVVTDERAILDHDNDYAAPQTGPALQPSSASAQGPSDGHFDDDMTSVAPENNMDSISGAGDMDDAYSAFDAESEEPDTFDQGDDDILGDIDAALAGSADERSFDDDQEDAPELVEPIATISSVHSDEGRGVFFDILADGRTAADEIVHVDSRSRESLYQVLAKAFLLFNEAQDDPDTYRSILKATGIREQARAPFTPVLKLVFGKNYDKTRITEYAAALSHARREGQTPETIASYITEYSGGIKGLVKAERIAKKREKGIAADEALESAKSRLGKRKPIGTIVAKHKVGDGEFALILARAGSNPNELKVIKVLEERQEVLDAALKRAVKGPTR